MQQVQTHINDLTSFMQTGVYASLDEATQAAIERKKAELCGKYFLEMARNLNRNKQRGRYAPHKAVMILAVMELVRRGLITSNVIRLDKPLKAEFKKVWEQYVPPGSPFKCEYHKPFTHMHNEPFWTLSADKDKALLSPEALYAFSHETSRRAIRVFLTGTIKEETIGEAYHLSHPHIDWLVAEDMLAFAPVLGFLIAI